MIDNMLHPTLLAFALTLVCAFSHATDLVGWTENSPRDEIRPTFSNEGQALVITHDAREGLDGWHQKTFTVRGGDFMKFSATRKTTGVDNPRHSGLARIVWTDDDGKGVTGNKVDNDGNSVIGNEVDNFATGNELNNDGKADDNLTWLIGPYKIKYT